MIHRYSGRLICLYQNCFDSNLIVNIPNNLQVKISMFRNRELLTGLCSVFLTVKLSNALIKATNLKFKDSRTCFYRNKTMMHRYSMSLNNII